MAQFTDDVDVGEAPDDDSGENFRSAWIKINKNFSENVTQQYKATCVLAIADASYTEFCEIKRSGAPAADGAVILLDLVLNVSQSPSASIAKQYLIALTRGINSTWQIMPSTILDAKNVADDFALDIKYVAASISYFLRVRRVGAGTDPLTIYISLINRSNDYIIFNALNNQGVADPIPTGRLSSAAISNKNGRVGIREITPSQTSDLTLSRASAGSKITLYDNGDDNKHSGLGIFNNDLTIDVAGNDDSVVLDYGGKTGTGTEFLRANRNDAIYTHNTLGALSLTRINNIPQKIITVRTIDDFPADVGGTITLEGNTTYLGDGSPTITSMTGGAPDVYFKMNDNTFFREFNLVTDRQIICRSVNIFSSMAIIYLGTSTLLISDPLDLLGEEDLISFDQIIIRCAAYGNVGNFVGNGEGGVVLFDKLVSNISNKLLTFNKVVGKLSNSVLTGFNDGITWTDCLAATADDVEMSEGGNIVGCRFLEFDGPEQQRISISGGKFIPKSNEHVFYFDPATSYLGGAGVIGSPVTLTEADVTKDNIFDTGSLTQKNDPLIFVGNAGIPDSTISAEVIGTDGGEHKIDVAYQWVFGDLNAIFTPKFLERVEIPDLYTGYMKYIGSESSVVSVDANLNLSYTGTATELELQARLACLCADKIDVTFNPTTDVVEELNTQIENGDTIVFSTTGTLPAIVAPGTQIRADAVYYVQGKTTNSFKIARVESPPDPDPPAPTIDFTNAGTGTHSYQRINLLGQVAKQNIIDAGNPAEFVCSALSEIDTNFKIIWLVSAEIASNGSLNRVIMNSVLARLKK